MTTALVEALETLAKLGGRTHLRQCKRLGRVRLALHPRAGNLLGARAPKTGGQFWPSLRGRCAARGPENRPAGRGLEPVCGSPMRCGRRSAPTT